MISIFTKHRYFFNRLIIVIIISLCLVGCFLSKEYRLKKNEANYFRVLTPPGSLKIGENLFYDQTESRNLDWLEYMYWTRKIFGKNSDEYKSTLLDTNVWVEKYPCLSFSFPDIYLRHPAYRDYPVVGISQKQAMDYSKWRSDRVLEYLLIKYSKIKYDTAQNRNSYFSIERYYSGSYKNYKPDSIFKYYPCFRLPTIQEWQYVMNYTDSVDKAYYKKHPKRKCNNCKTDWSDFQSDIIPCVNDTFAHDPLVPVFAYKGSPFFNLRGNVSEWTSENEVCIGGGWADSKGRILQTDTFHLKTQNAWTGFRNVCEWKEWKR